MSEERPLRPRDRHDLRLPNGMRERLKRSATLAGRTLNAELVHRLQGTLDGTYGLPLPPEILKMLKTAAEEAGRSLENEGYVRLLDSLNGWSEVQALRRDLDDARAALARLNALNRGTPP